eukprot:536498_1
MIWAIFAVAICVYQIEALNSDFKTREEAEQYVEQYIAYEDHLNSGNINENFEFIQMFVSKDLLYCVGAQCTEGRAEFIQNYNALARVIKEWSVTIDVRNFGKKYLALSFFRTVTFANDETIKFPSDATLVLNDDGSIKAMIQIPLSPKYSQEWAQILERNSGVQTKDDL